ncbi:hypothetical protein PBI_MORRISSEY_10 [Gordonia phage Morrissey]|nr:hypothetical protein PBI_MORRISSEY_10 [Gordonia phage Morrissey]
MIGYSGSHMRVYADRGAAREHLCVCGKRAEEWAYRGGCPDEVIGEVSGVILRWSPHPEMYDPLCKVCHRVKDLHVDRCRAGHDTSTYGRYREGRSGSRCRECARSQVRDRKLGMSDEELDDLRRRNRESQRRRRERGAK